MDIVLPTTAATVALSCLFIAAATYATWQRIVKNARKEREDRAARILQAAREEDALLKAKLEARIEKMDAQLKNLELNVNKDITHLKETYSAEIKVLGEKIEALRGELRDQHSQMVGLLSKLIDAKE